VYKNQPLPDILNNYSVPHRLISVQEVMPSSSPLKLIRYLKDLYVFWRKANSINYLPMVDEMDVFLQFDFLLGVPSHSGLKTVLLKYDVIPLLSESHYLPNFRQARNRTGSTKSAIKAQQHRLRYLWLLRKSLQRSDLVLAISEQTKQDLISLLNIAEGKIEILPLAADDLMSDSAPDTKSRHIRSFDWRFIPGQARYRSVSISDRPYLLYIGGVDPRRRVQDLVLAYNLMRAEGIECDLMLAGYDFQDLDTVLNNDVRQSIESSSYGDHIYLLGFISPEVKSSLYRNAAVFVYPTLYEGFGLPVLEAMQQGCPVVCYDNSSLKEVGGNAALYATEPEDIADIAKRLIIDKDFSDKTSLAGKAQAKHFSWQKTTFRFTKLVEGLKDGK
jgi:glycosyltransferase involved in cell wall biosynthesis